MKSKREQYISELNENINYGDRSPKGSTSCQSLGLLKKKLDAMPSNSKIILRRVLVETVTYGRELISFIVNQNVNDDVLVLVVTFAGVEEPVNREGFKSDSSSRKVCVKTLGS